MKEQERIIVVNVDAQLGIGKDGDMPWHIPEDLRWFKNCTSQASEGKQNALIMGRTTYLSIPKKFRPFSDRINVVLSRRETEIDGALVAPSLGEAYKLVPHAERCFIIGGGSVYQQAMNDPTITGMYITHQERTYDCDTFFPKEYTELFERVKAVYTSESNDPPFTIYQYRRRK